MCSCDKPTVNGQIGYKWQPNDKPTIYPPSPPSLQKDDVLLFDEPGRCGGLDSHSHHFRVVKSYSTRYLLVHHGGGEERIRLLPHDGLLDTLKTLDSNARYWLLHAIYSAHHDGERAGTEKTAAYWRQAAYEKRIKVRKIRNSSLLKVEVVPSVLAKR